MKYEDQQQTIFNSAVASLERIHDLLLDCNKYKRECRLQGYNLDVLNYWKSTVYSLFDELDCKLIKDGKKIRQEIRELIKELEAKPPIITIKKTPNGNVRVINPKIFNFNWAVISSIERKLRFFADKKGMLIPDNRETPGAAIR